MPKIQKSLGLFLVTGVISCSPASPLEDFSCTTATVSSDVPVEKADAYTLAVLNIQSSADGLTAKNSWCNATVNLKPSTTGIKAQITTAKHCINPWTFRDLTMELAGNTGYIEAKLKSDYLDKIAALSTASSGKIENIASEDEIDFSTAFTPSTSPLEYWRYVGSIWDDGSLPLSFNQLSSVISTEEAQYGTPLCEVNANPEGFKGKACFTFFDMVSFEAELRVEEKFMAPISKAAASKSPSSTETQILSMLEKRTQLELELFQLQIATKLKSCESFDTSEACRSKKTKLENLLADSRFYTANNYATYGVQNKTKDELAAISNEAIKDLVITSGDLMEYSRTNITESTHLRLVNNLSVEGNRFMAAKIPMNRTALLDFTGKPYGFVAQINPSKLQIFKGDSGSMITYKGIPMAILSTYAGEPTTSGLDVVIPSARDELIIPESVDTPVASNPAAPEIDRIDVEYTSGPAPSGPDSFDSIIGDANATGFANGGCI